MDLKMLSLDDLQTILHRIDTHTKTVREASLKREDVVAEMNSRVDMTTNAVAEKVWYDGQGIEHIDIMRARRAYFQ